MWVHVCLQERTPSDSSHETMFQRIAQSPTVVLWLQYAQQKQRLTVFALLSAAIELTTLETKVHPPRISKPSKLFSTALSPPPTLLFLRLASKTSTSILRSPPSSICACQSTSFVTRLSNDIISFLWLLMNPSTSRFKRACTDYLKLAKSHTIDLESTFFNTVTLLLHSLLVYGNILIAPSPSPLSSMILVLNLKILSIRITSTLLFAISTPSRQIPLAPFTMT